MEKLQSERGNIISVEIAIQRELAYRKKVELLGLKPYGDSGWKEFLPLQAPMAISKPPLPSSCVIPRINQAAPSSSRFQCHVPEPSPSSISGPSFTPLKRKAPMMISNSLNSGHGDNFFCKVCRVPCSGPRNFKMHISGRPHRAKVQEMNGIRQKMENGGKDGEEDANDRKWCGLCKIWCMNVLAFKQHLEGKKHVMKLHSVREKSALHGCERS